MTWVLIVIVVAWALVERHHRRRLERTRMEAIEATGLLLTGSYQAVINHMAVRHALRIRQLNAQMDRQRQVDLVEHFDRGIFVAESGGVAQIGNEVGQC